MWRVMVDAMNAMPALAENTVAPDAPLSEDDHLLDRMRRDDVEAYRKLVERHIDQAFALALRVLKNPADAEDVTQDAFVSTWMNRHKWQAGRAKFTTWLYRVIVNRCIDMQRLPRNEWLDNVPEPEDEKPDAVASIHKRQVYAYLEDALERLPPQQRVAVVLSYYEDMSAADIGDVMGASVSAVESLLKRGRARLRELLRRNERDVRQILEG